MDVTVFCNILFMTYRTIAGKSSSYVGYSAMVTPVLASSTRQTPAEFKAPPPLTRTKTPLAEQNTKQRQVLKVSSLLHVLSYSVVLYTGSLKKLTTLWLQKDINFKVTVI